MFLLKTDLYGSLRAILFPPFVQTSRTSRIIRMKRPHSSVDFRSSECSRRVRSTVPFLVSSDKGLKCPVCLLEFQEHETVREMPCKHLFHSGCILPWLGKVKSSFATFNPTRRKHLTVLCVCRFRRTPARCAGSNCRPTTLSMKSLKKTRWGCCSQSLWSHGEFNTASVGGWIRFLSRRSGGDRASTDWRTCTEPCTREDAVGRKPRETRRHYVQDGGSGSCTGANVCQKCSTYPIFKMILSKLDLIWFLPGVNPQRNPFDSVVFCSTELVGMELKLEKILTSNWFLLFISSFRIKNSYFIFYPQNLEKRLSSMFLELWESYSLSDLFFFQHFYNSEFWNR